MALRKFGQQIIERLGGKRVHPAWVVPGGVSRPLDAEQRAAILEEIPDARARAHRSLEWYKANVATWADEAAHLGEFPSLHMGLVHETGNAAYSDGLLRVVDGNGWVLADGVDPRSYWDYLGEAVEPWSYLKSTYFKPLGYPAGIYRVGPLARLNVVDRLGTAAADAELAEYRERLGRYPSSSFHYHYARLIEILHCIDMIDEILSDPDILNPHVRARGAGQPLRGRRRLRGPARGTLIHHYRVDDDGVVQWVNLVIATGHNNLAMNRSVLQIARQYVHGADVKEGMLNRVEAVIRCYDPCLSCSTHAIGQMPLNVDIRDVDGALIRQVSR